MEFSISSNALQKQLSSISGVLGSNQALPILENFLFTLEKNKLSISATDLDSTISTSVQVESEDSGSIAIPAKLLLEMLKAMPDHPITFSVNEKFATTISSEFGAYKLTGHDPADFPKVPDMKSVSSIEIDAAILSKSISKTIFATGDDDLRPAMTGVFIQMDTSGITFVATDAHKLVRYKRNDIKSSKPSSFIIPKKPLSVLKNILNDGKVTVEYNNVNVSFKFGNSHLICRLIDAKYPDYNAVIPKENPNVLSIDKNIFNNSLKRIAIFANKSTSQVRLVFKGGDLNVFAEDLNFSNEANEKLKCEYKGDDMEIGFSAKILSDVVSAMDGDEMIMEMSAPNRAGVIKPAAASKDEDVLMLVMPQMLNQ